MQLLLLKYWSPSRSRLCVPFCSRKMSEFPKWSYALDSLEEITRYPSPTSPNTGDPHSSELSTSSRVSPRASAASFYHRVQWSPDGTCLLSHQEGAQLQVLEPANISDFWSSSSSSSSSSTSSSISPYPREQSASLRSLWSTKEGDGVSDVKWFPRRDTATQDRCFLTAVHQHPIRMWDINTGKIRCVYSAYDDMDELTSPVSLAIHPTGGRYVLCVSLFLDDDPLWVSVGLRRW